jgi:hypothetical protein
MSTSNCRMIQTDNPQGYSSFIPPSRIIPMREHTADLMGGVKLKFSSRFPGVVLFSEIYQGGSFIQLASLFHQDGLIANATCNKMHSIVAFVEFTQFNKTWFWGVSTGGIFLYVEYFLALSKLQQLLKYD